MDTLGIDIAKAKFDVCLDKGSGAKLCHAQFLNAQADFEQLALWLERHRANADGQLHACMEATGNLRLDLALFLNESGNLVSIVNPVEIKAFAQAGLSRNKTDKLDAALIARFAEMDRDAKYAAGHVVEPVIEEGTELFFLPASGDKQAIRISPAYLLCHSCRWISPQKARSVPRMHDDRRRAPIPSPHFKSTGGGAPETLARPERSACAKVRRLQ